jgi:hypothetical protein
MKVTASLIVLAGSVALSGAGPQTFRAATQVVTVQVSVLQGKTPLRGLTTSEFELTDNGVPQHVQLIPADATPIDLTLIIGAYGARLEASRIGPYLKRLVSWLQAPDRIQVLGLGRDVRNVLTFRSASDVPSDGLIGALTRSSGGTDPIHDPLLLGSPSFDALLLALIRPVDPDRRSVIVRLWFEGNSGNAVPDGGLVADVAARSDSVLYVAYAPGRTEGMPTDSTPLQYELQSLTSAAEATGGALRHVGNGVGAFKDTLDEFRQSYVLRYTATGVPTGGWHALSVRVPNRPSAVVHARKGYVGR